MWRAAPPSLAATPQFDAPSRHNSNNEYAFIHPIKSVPNSIAVASIPLQTAARLRTFAARRPGGIRMGLIEH